MKSNSAKLNLSKIIKRENMSMSNYGRCKDCKWGEPVSAVGNGIALTIKL
ncbi:Uncharacterised protein [Catenibacterium mitsuokai]|nr:Uncharacterised protein [Catenibacterium mitsuokai]